LWQRELEARGFSWEPSFYIVEKMNVAILNLRDYRGFGQSMPHAGGHRDQPVNWTRPMRCILAAEVEAERQKKAEEAQS